MMSSMKTTMPRLAALSQARPYPDMPRRTKPSQAASFRARSVLIANEENYLKKPSRTEPSPALPRHALPRYARPCHARP
jgi:hypothetical protein